MIRTDESNLLREIAPGVTFEIEYGDDWGNIIFEGTPRKAEIERLAWVHATQIIKQDPTATVRVDFTNDHPTWADTREQIANEIRKVPLWAWALGLAAYSIFAGVLTALGVA